MTTNQKALYTTSLVISILVRKINQNPISTKSKWAHFGKAKIGKGAKSPSHGRKEAIHFKNDISSFLKQLPKLS